MTKSVILLVLAVVVISSLAPATFAVCSTCGDNVVTQDWAASAASFIEGKPINDVPPSWINPKQARLSNTEFNSSLLKESPGQAPNSVSNPTVSDTAVSNTATSNAAVTPIHNTTPMLNIVLNDIRASPNPANRSNPVMITAVFGNNSSNSQINETPNNLSASTDLKNFMVYADIKNSAGTEVGRVNLQRTSENEYAGIWNTNVASGTYKATIDASGSEGSETFNDALQIVVSGSKNTTSNIHAIRNLR